MPTEHCADDALILNIFHKKLDQSVVESTLQPTLSSAENWALSWRRNFGQPKTQFPFFNRANSKGFDLSNRSLSIEGIKIYLEKCNKRLGITNSSTLEWPTHISDVIRAGKTTGWTPAVDVSRSATSCSCRTLFIVCPSSVGVWLRGMAQWSS